MVGNFDELTETTVEQYEMLILMAFEGIVAKKGAAVVLKELSPETVQVLWTAFSERCGSY